MPRLIHRAGRGLLRVVPPLKRWRRLVLMMQQYFRAKDEEFIVRLDCGYHMIINPSDYVSFAIYMCGYYEADAVREIQRRLKPGMTFFDIGGHFGQYTLVASAAVGHEGQVHTFEPGPQQFDLLSRNVELNNCGNVTTNNMALGTEKGKVGFVVGPQINLGASHVAADEPPTFEVEMSTLDDYCDERGVSQIDVMKMDVEGAELMVLDGARRTLKDSPPSAVFYEAIDHQCARFGYHPSELHDRLASYGYTICVTEGGKHIPVSPEERGKHFDFVAIKSCQER